MNQQFGISNCADPEWLNSRIAHDEEIKDYYSDPDDLDCIDMYEDKP